jgi:hypothetical protein
MGLVIVPGLQIPPPSTRVLEGKVDRNGPLLTGLARFAICGILIAND